MKLEGGFSNVLDKKVDEQIRANKLEVDVIVLQLVQDFERWKKEGLLLPFKPEGFDKIDANWKDADGMYVGVSVFAHPYAYNSNLVKPEDIPKSALDFLKPQFQGKVVSAYPQDDDTTLYVFDSITRKYGLSYWDKYFANKPVFYQGHLGVARAISAGTALVTLDTIAGISMPEKIAGKPHELYFSKIDPIPIWAAPGAVFKDARHPNAAKLFLNWYLSVESQSQLSPGNWPARSDVTPSGSMMPILSYNVVNNYRDFVTNQNHLEELRDHFGKLAGPIVNTGGVR